jgi:hypothetical protein
MWTEKNWMFVQRYYRADTIYSIDYGTQTYTLNGDKYEADILYLSNQLFDGTVNRNMTMELKNDTSQIRRYQLLAGITTRINHSVDQNPETLIWGRCTTFLQEQLSHL